MVPLRVVRPAPVKHENGAPALVFGSMFHRPMPSTVVISSALASPLMSFDSLVETSPPFGSSRLGSCSSVPKHAGGAAGSRPYLPKGAGLLCGTGVLAPLQEERFRRRALDNSISRTCKCRPASWPHLGRSATDTFAGHAFPVWSEPCKISPPAAFMLLPFGQENCDRVILVSSPTHLPRCLRDACSLWLDSPHPPPQRAEGATLTAGKGAENAETTGRGGQGNQGRLDEHGGGEEGPGRGRGRRRQPRSWQPLVLASPSNTNYAGYGPGDVAIVEPPHRGDSDRGLGDGGITATGGNSCRLDQAPSTVFRGDSGRGEGKEAEGGASEARDLSGAEETTTPSLLLHDLVTLALRVGKRDDEGFRRELQALLGRYVDIRQ